MRSVLNALELTDNLHNYGLLTSQKQAYVVNLGYAHCQPVSSRALILKRAPKD